MKNLLFTGLLLLSSTWMYSQILGDCNQGDADFRWSINGCCVTFYQCNSAGQQTWDFGDGSPTSSSGYHCYSSPGSYTVTHTFFNGSFPQTHQETITIAGSCCTNDLNASWTSSFNQINIFGLTFWAFQLNSNVSSSDPISSYNWTFYVYNTCTQQTTTQTFTGPNVSTWYNATSCQYQIWVCLTVTDDCGETDTDCHYLIALPREEQNLPEHSLSTAGEIEFQYPNDGFISSKEVSVFSPQLLQVLNQGETELLKVFPNPIQNDQLRLQLPTIDKVSMEEIATSQLVIYHTDGKAVGRYPVNDSQQQSIAVDHLPAGVYMVGLTVRGELLQTKRFIIQ